MSLRLECKIFTDTRQNLLVHALLLLISAIFYGAQAILLCIIVIITCKRELIGVPISKARIYLLVMAITMMIVTTEIVAFIMWDVVQVQPGMISGNLNMDRITELEGRVIKGRVIGIFLNALIGDCIVFWRAWVLWRYKRKMVYLPGILLLCSGASAVSFIGCFAKQDSSMLEKCEPLEILAIAFTNVTNIATTASIWYYTWLHWRAVRGYIDAGNRQARSEKVLVLVLESGIIYTAITIISGILLILTDHLCNRSFAWRLAAAIIDVLAASIVSIYPTLLIAVIFLHRSVWDPAEQSCSSQS
ncbi:hypothetical protein Moror_15341 [Moniliophthora roreri MCA 2997]|uniref:Uncharacterized protein n=1 Tax=Moniliophthora roreri (strain MCA 2997) TaxID=1381753 RepID=V2Y812_MONRO|nr:hypothetical protein Moror_15341 [Moniliophthora roreri MCA 2997]